MMSKKEFLKSQKECASMLGMNVINYQQYVKNLKVPNIKKEKPTYDNSILNRLGISESMLKKTN